MDPTFSPEEAVDHRADSKYRNKDDSRDHQGVVHACAVASHLYSRSIELVHSERISFSSACPVNHSCNGG